MTDLNATQLLEKPFETVFSPFTNLLGTGFYLIPLTMICVALYVNTRDVVVVSAFMVASGSLLAGGGIFTGYGEMAFAYMMFAALGIVGIVLSVFFER